jgi:hypothetical protein
MAMMAKIRFMLDPMVLEHVKAMRRHFPEMKIEVEWALSIDRDASIHVDTVEQFLEMATKLADDATRPEPEPQPRTSLGDAMEPAVSTAASAAQK